MSGKIELIPRDIGKTPGKIELLLGVILITHDQSRHTQIAKAQSAKNGLIGPSARREEEFGGALLDRRTSGKRLPKP